MLFTVRVVAVVLIFTQGVVTDELHAEVDAVVELLLPLPPHPVPETKTMPERAAIQPQYVGTRFERFLNIITRTEVNAR